MSSKFARATVESAQRLDMFEKDRPRGGCVLGLHREQRREMIDESQPAERAAKITGASPARKHPRDGAVAQIGEALQSHRRGQGFESPPLHQEVRASAGGSPRQKLFDAKQS
jgi:hypothetical protein